MHSEFMHLDTVQETEQMYPSDSAVIPGEHALEDAIDKYGSLAELRTSD